MALLAKTHMGLSAFFGGITTISSVNLRAVTNPSKNNFDF